MGTSRKRAALPAKLTRPRSKWVVPRPRLVGLAADSEARVLWVQGRPGAGKTIFASALTEGRRGDRLWVQLDADDGNFAILLDYLRAAMPARARALPAPDAAAPDLAGFMRRFARLLFSSLRDDSLLVLEDFHEITGSQAATLLPILCAEAGGQARVVITSREPPPAAFAELLVRRQMQVFDSDILRFTDGEAAALLALLGVDGEPDMICREADGWAAGITLLAQKARAADATRSAIGQDELFDYFARQVFNSLPGAHQSALLRLSLLSRFTDLAAIEMTGLTGVPGLLADMLTRNLFVERRLAQGGEWFQLHPLFSRFLRARLTASLDAGVLHALRLTAAEIEARLLNHAAAVKLLIACGEMRRAEGVILGAAVPLLSAGRDAELAELIGALQAAGPGPAHSRWLQYWLGVAHAHTDLALALAAFKRSHELALEAGDRFVAFMSAASTTLGSALYERAMHEIQPWAERMRKFASDQIPFPDANFEIAAMAAALASHVHCEIEPVPLAHAVARLEVLLSNPRVDPSMLLVGGAMLLEHYHDMGSHHRGLPVCQLLLELAGDPRVTEYRRARTHLAVSIFHWYASVDDLGENLLRQSERHVAAAQALAEANGFQDILAQIQLRQSDIHWRHARHEESLATLEAARPYLSARHPFVAAAFHQKRCMTLLVMNRVRDALMDVEAGIDLGKRAGLPAAELSFHHWLEATARFRLGELEAAESCAERAIAHAPPGHARAYAIARPLFALYAAWRGGDPTRLDRLRKFFAELSTSRSLRTGMLMAPEMAEMCVAALREGVEVEFVSEMIQVRGFCPPAEDPPECWPWPIRLRLLGPWSVEIHGVRWTPAHKTPRKPLELLKYLAAGGEAAFEGIAIDRIIEALWPDPEADDPRSSFDIALHRLRKLLTVENAIVAGDGRLRLSAEKVWTDVAEWERAARRIRAGGISAEVAGRMRDLYRGAPFQEESAAWALSRREQLQARFIESVIEAGAALEGAGLYGQARLLYARAAEHESIVEPLYRGMMRCCLAAEEFAEGLRAYRRCREMLSMVLSVAPSSETEVLRNALLAASSFKAPD